MPTAISLSLGFIPHQKLDSKENLSKGNACELKNL